MADEGRLLHADRVPGVEEAIFDERKFTRYLLDPSSEHGSSKAAFFATLGYSLEGWRELRDAVAAAAPRVPGHVSRPNRVEGGDIYVALVAIEGPLAASAVRTYWHVRPGSPTRFLNALPPQRRAHLH